MTWHPWTPSGAIPVTQICLDAQPTGNGSLEKVSLHSVQCADVIRILKYYVRLNITFLLLRDGFCFLSP